MYHKLAHCGSKIPAVQALRMGDAAYASLYFFTNPKKKSKCNPLRKEWKLLGLGYATLAKTKINIYCIKRTILDSLFFSYGRWYKMQVPPACTILFFFFSFPPLKGYAPFFFIHQSILYLKMKMKTK